MQLERWQKFSKSQQIGAIAAEIMRAKNWQGKNKENFLSAIERALELIDFIIDDNRWRTWCSIFYGLRQELSKFYLGDNRKDIGVLYNAL